jgi:hypothetical protein
MFWFTTLKVNVHSNKEIHVKITVTIETEQSHKFDIVQLMVHVYLGSLVTDMSSFCRHDISNLKQDKQCTCKSNIEARYNYNFCSGKAIITANSECVVLIIQHTKRMRSTMLLSLACPA